MKDKTNNEACNVNNLRRSYIDEIQHIHKKVVDGLRVCSFQGDSRDHDSQRTRGMGISNGTKFEPPCALGFYIVCVKSI